jgi:hypothetical protein
LGPAGGVGSGWRGVPATLLHMREEQGAGGKGRHCWERSGGRPGCVWSVERPRYCD